MAGERKLVHLTFISLLFLSVGIFTSISLSALSHIFITIPAFVGAYQFYKRPSGKLPISFWLLVLFFVTIVLSVLFNLSDIEKPIKLIFKGKYFILAALSIFAYYYFFNPKNNKKWKVAFSIFLLATTLASLSGIIGLKFGFNPLKGKPPCHPERACGLYGMYMTYGYGISLLSTILIGIRIYGNKIKSFYPMWPINLALIVSLTGLYLSYARGALVAFLVSIAFYFFKKSLKKFIIFSAVGSLAFGIAFLSIPKLKNMFTSRSTSNLQRISFYKAALYAAKESPVFGLGYRNFEPRMKEIKKKYKIEFPEFGSHAHNNFLELLASTGGLGMSIFGLWVLFWLIETFLADDLLSLISFPFVINFLLSGMVQYTFGDGENLFLILNVWAITVAYKLSLQNGEGKLAESVSKL